MDVTFGRLQSGDPQIDGFYLGGLDAYRIAFNDDFSQPFVPAKQHFRSDTVDSQRGEVEWRGGNLYFDHWDYEFKARVLAATNSASGGQEHEQQATASARAWPASCCAGIVIAPSRRARKRRRLARRALNAEDGERRERRGDHGAQPRHRLQPHRAGPMRTGPIASRSCPSGRTRSRRRKDGKSLGTLARRDGESRRRDDGGPRPRRVATLDVDHGEGSRVVNAVDVTSTEIATNITREELERLPVERDLLSVALLAPGLNKGDDFRTRRRLVRRILRGREHDLHQRPQRHRLLQPHRLLVGAVRVLQGVPGQDRRLLGRVRPHDGRRDQRRDALGHERVRVRHGESSGSRIFLQTHRRRHPSRSPCDAQYDEYDRANYDVYASRADHPGQAVLLRAVRVRATTSPSTPTTPAAASSTARPTRVSGARRSTGRSTTSTCSSCSRSPTRTRRSTDSYKFDLGDRRARRPHENRRSRRTAATTGPRTYTGYLTDSLSVKALYGENEREVLAAGSPNDADCNRIRDCARRRPSTWAAPRRQRR